MRALGRVAGRWTARATRLTAVFRNLKWGLPVDHVCTYLS